MLVRFRLLKYPLVLWLAMWLPFAQAGVEKGSETSAPASGSNSQSIPPNNGSQTGGIEGVVPGGGTVGGSNVPTGSAGSADNLLFTGSFLYNIPLVVPPGIAGMQPQVTLNYNSSSGNGWVGVGWDLSFGSIQRATKNGIPSYTDADTFVLTMKGQSQELVKIPDGTYRAKVEEGFLKFARNGDEWIVTDKSGTVFRFGHTAASRITNPSSGSGSPGETPITPIDDGGTVGPVSGTSNIFLWALDSVTDRNGNNLTLSYASNADDNQIYVNQILYTGNTATNRTPDRKVVFTIENRGDVLSSCRSGFLIRTAKRLSAVDTFVLRNGAWDRVNNYSLTYLMRADTNRSLLQKVTQTGYLSGQSPRSIDLAKFTYPNEQRGWTSTPNFNLPGALTTGAHDWIPTQWQLIDIDSDGRPDFVQSSEPGVDASWINWGSGWRQDQNWTLPVDLVNGNWIPNGVNFADLNGDGRPDLIYGRAGYGGLAWLNTGSGWAPDNRFRAPAPFVSTDGAPLGARIIDLNNDGRADVVWTPRPGTIPGPTTWINTGIGWETDSKFTLPVRLLEGTVSTAQLIDLNGDNRPDLVYAPQNGPRRSWINTKNGWNEQSNWALPEYFFSFTTSSQPVSNEGVRFADLNGDGLPDLVAAWNENGTSYHHSYINTGNGWREDANFALPENLAVPTKTRATNGVFVDINNDGLTDFMYSYYTVNGNFVGTWLNTGHGWAAADAWRAPQALGVQDNHWPGAQVLDLDGDQNPDFAISYLTPGGGLFANSWLSAAAPHGDLLSGIQNPFGGKITVDYEKSLTYTNTFLPFSTWVVKTITNDPGATASPVIPINYSYSGGLFDVTDKEFLGFRQVTTTDALGNKSVATFLQDKSTDGIKMPVNALKGRIFKVERYDASNRLLTTDETSWGIKSPYSGVYFVRTNSVSSSLNDVSPAKTTRTDFVYDETDSPSFGNLIRTYTLGDVSDPTDDRAESVEYALNSGANLIAFPSRTRVLDSAGNTLSETRIYYDGSDTLGNITKGNATRISRWLNPPGRYVDTRSSYNQYGQITDIEDALHKHTRTTYNALGYPITVTNTLGHSVQSTYDMGTGNVQSNTSANNQITRYIYDSLGRRTKEIGPLDSESLPSAETNYHDELRGNPTRQYVESFVRTRNGAVDTIWSRDYYDGLGRTVKAERKDAGTKSVIVETVYDARGFDERTSAPRFATTSSPLWTWVYRDALGRVTRVTKPDNTSTLTTYVGRTTSVQDANGNIQTAESDAYGRVTGRTEPSIQKATVYKYDTLGRLIKVTDSKENQTLFVYDSFGRKTAMVDPNAGSWAYAYDDNGNLVAQTDARGVKLSFTYDDLNRITQKKLSADPRAATGQAVGTVLASYTYDAVKPAEQSSWPNEKGKLTIVTDPSGETRFYHDTLGRVVKDVKRVDTTEYRTLTAYDALDHVTQITYPNDQVVNYSFDDAARPAQTTNGNNSAVYAAYPSYNEFGQPLVRTQNNGLTRTTYVYDPNKFTLSKLTTTTGAGTPQTVQNLSYNFDSVGNISSIDDGVHPDRKQSFTYDALYRLTRAQGIYGDSNYKYDELGNFQTKENVTYDYRDASHPYAVTDTRPTDMLAKDSSTLIAWDLDPSEPIYTASGTVTRTGGIAVGSATVVLSGGVDEAVLTDASGRYLLRGLPGGTGASYSLSVSTFATTSPVGYSLNSLAANRSGLNFLITPNLAPPIDVTKLRIPRTRFSSGGPQGSESNGNTKSGQIGGGGFGGFSATNGGQQTISGYSPMPDPADFVQHPPAQYILPPDAYSQGILGPAFTTGRYRGALSFNGATDLFMFPNSTNANPANLTLMLWVKPQAYPTFGYATLIAKSSASAVGYLPDGYRLVINNTGNVQFEIGDAVAPAVLSSPSALPLNQWTFVAATFDGAAMRVFLNGKSVASRTTSTRVIPNSNSVLIGSSLTTYRRLATGTSFMGALDEPRVQDRPWSISEISQAMNAFSSIGTYTYDANGNLATKTNGGVTWNYRFDAEGRLAEIRTSTTPIASFVYDANGIRVKKITPDGTTLTLSKLFEIRSDGSMVNHVFAGGDLICNINQPVGAPSQTYYVHADHLGSVTLVTDQTGAVAEETVYSPFGESVDYLGDSPLTRKYTGQEFDMETDLYYYNARYYAPTVGRFLSADTIVPSAGDPQSLNRYAYCRNSPIMNIDPSGQSWLSNSIHKLSNWANNHFEFAGLVFQAFDPFFGSLYLSQRENGRAILLGEVIAAGSFGVGGPTVGWGAVSGEMSSAYTARKTGQNMMGAVALGGLEGAAISAAFAGIDATDGSWVAKAIVKANISAALTAAHGGDMDNIGLAWGISFGAAAANAHFSKTVGYSPDPTPGTEIENADHTYLENHPPKGKDVFGRNSPTKISSLGHQGTPLMRTLDAIPGMNSVSELHDQWLINNPNLSNFGTMVPAFVTSYSAQFGGALSPTVPILLGNRDR